MREHIGTHSASSHYEKRTSPRSPDAAAAVDRLERVRDLRGIALSVALGGALWLVFSSLARLWE